jgi:hypothetical protein
MDAPSSRESCAARVGGAVVAVVLLLLSGSGLGVGVARLVPVSSIASGYCGCSCCRGVFNKLRSLLLNAANGFVRRNVGGDCGEGGGGCGVLLPVGPLVIVEENAVSGSEEPAKEEGPAAVAMLLLLSVLLSLSPVPVPVVVDDDDRKGDDDAADDTAAVEAAGATTTGPSRDRCFWYMTPT